MKKIEKNNEAHAIRSAAVLKSDVAKEITKVFGTALRCIEIKFGRHFEGFEVLRAEILRSGNDSIRKIGDVIDNRYNVEMIPEIVTINFSNKEKE
jgi:hypothetical protein